MLNAHTRAHKKEKFWFWMKMWSFEVELNAWDIPLWMERIQMQSFFHHFPEMNLAFFWSEHGGLTNIKKICSLGIDYIQSLRFQPFFASDTKTDFDKWCLLAHKIIERNSTQLVGFTAMNFDRNLFYLSVEKRDWLSQAQIIMSLLYEISIHVLTQLIEIDSRDTLLHGCTSYIVITLKLQS